MRIISIFISIVVVLFGVVFAVKNSDSVVIQFLEFKGSAPLSLVMVLSFAVGAVFGVLVSMYSIVKLKLTVSQLEKSQLHDARLNDKPQPAGQVKEAD